MVAKRLKSVEQQLAMLTEPVDSATLRAAIEQRITNWRAYSAHNTRPSVILAREWRHTSRTRNRASAFATRRSGAVCQLAGNRGYILLVAGELSGRTSGVPVRTDDRDVT